MTVFEELNGLNVNGHTEKKTVSGKELTYLSWPWAWAEVSEKLKVKSVKLIIPTGTTATVYPGSRYERTVGPGEYIIPLYQ